MPNPRSTRSPRTYTSGSSDQVIQLLKDRCHELLVRYCEPDPATDCWIWTRSWQTSKGLGVLRIAGRLFTVHRVSAWVYGVADFDLFDTSIRIYHARCRTPACFNYEHLDWARGPGGVNTALARLGRFGRGIRGQGSGGEKMQRGRGVLAAV